MSITEVFLSEAVATAIILMFDAPSGMIADSFGRKRCVVVGKFLFLGSTICIACMTSPIHGYVANILWAFSVVLISGAESALVYDELKKRNALGEYQKLVKDVQSYSFLLVAFTTVITGFVAEINLRLPLILSIPGVCIATVLACYLPRDVPSKSHRAHTFESYKHHMYEAVQEVMRSSRLKVLFVWLAIFAVMGKLYFFIYNPYLELVQVPYSHIGIIFSLINIASFLTAKYAFWFKERINHVGLWIGFVIQGVTMFLQAYFVQYISGWFFISQGIARGYVNTVATPLLNEEIESQKRATVLSFHSSLMSLLQVGLFLVMAPFSGDIPLFLCILGGVTLVMSFLSRKV